MHLGRARGRSGTSGRIFAIVSLSKKWKYLCGAKARAPRSRALAYRHNTFNIQQNIRAAAAGAKKNAKASNKNKAFYRYSAAERESAIERHRSDMRDDEFIREEINDSILLNLRNGDQWNGTEDGKREREREEKSFYSIRYLKLDGGVHRTPSVCAPRHRAGYMVNTGCRIT